MPFFLHSALVLQFTIWGFEGCRMKKSALLPEWQCFPGCMCWWFRGEEYGHSFSNTDKRGAVWVVKCMSRLQVSTGLCLWLASVLFTVRGWLFLFVAVRKTKQAGTWATVVYGLWWKESDLVQRELGPKEVIWIVFSHNKASLLAINI